MPKVSVIIPCYNYAQYLLEAVESVINQNFRDFEIIIINDGSTDKTRTVAEGLIEKYPRQSIKLVNQANQGLSAARNNGIAVAHGEYILPLDADDKIMPTFLEETARVLDENPGLTISYTNFQFFGDVTQQEELERIDTDFDMEKLLRHNILTATSLFRKSAWEEVGGYKTTMRGGYEDWEFWITLGEAGHKGRLIDKPLFLYRKHGKSMIDETFALHNRLYNRIKMLHPALYCPRIGRYGKTLAKAAIVLKIRLRDPVSHFLYRNFPRIHSLLRGARELGRGLLKQVSCRDYR